MKTNKKTQAGIVIKAGVRAAGLPTINHNRRGAVLSVKSSVKAGAGIVYLNHSRRLA